MGVLTLLTDSNNDHQYPRDIERFSYCLSLELSSGDVRGIATAMQPKQQYYVDACCKETGMSAPTS